MRIQTILNRVEKFKSFVYGEGTLEEHDDGPSAAVRMVPRKRQSGVLAPEAAAALVLRTTVWKNDDLSSSHCGEFWSSWRTGCGE